MLKPDAVISDIVETLTDAQEFVRGIVGSFIQHSFDKQQSVVRIGISGSGTVPNYSIEEPCERIPLVYNGEIIGGTSVRRMVFKGQGHREILEDSARGESWSSAAMSFAEVQTLLGDLRQRKKRR